MDINALMGTLLSSDAVATVSQKTGTSAADVQSVLSSALPQLLSGAQAQADNSATAESFLGALAQHGQADTSDLSAFVQNVDLKDGAKIVSHLLGSEQADTTAAVEKKTGVSAASTNNILAAAAPLLMSLLGQQTGATQSTASTSGISSLMGSLLGNVDTASLISGLLGGATTTTTGGKKDDKKDSNPLSGLGDLLGGLLK